MACLFALLLAGCEPRVEPPVARDEPQREPSALPEAPATPEPSEPEPNAPSPSPTNVRCEDAESCARACDAGNAQACHRLGVMHRDGKGAKRDEAKAHELFERGCFHGSTAACDELGH